MLFAWFLVFNILFAIEILGWLRFMGEDDESWEEIEDFAMRPLGVAMPRRGAIITHAIIILGSIGTMIAQVLSMCARLG